jgi:hypothetical protein
VVNAMRWVVLLLWTMLFLGCGGRTPPLDYSEELTGEVCVNRGGMIFAGAGDAGPFCPDTFERIGDVTDRPNAICCKK